MRFPFRLACAFSACAGIVVLTACSAGGGTSAPGLLQSGVPSNAQSIGRRSAGVVSLGMRKTVRSISAGPARVINPISRLPLGPFDFVSDFGNSEVYVLNPTNGSVEATLTSSTGLDFPQGMSVTNNPPRLYVANSGADDILVYKSTTQPAVLTNGGLEPGDVAVDSHGNVAAMDYDGYVTCFVGGSNTPTRTISGTSGTGTFYNIYFGAFDAGGNLYIDGFDYAGNSLVGEIVGGCATPGSTVTDLTTSNTIDFPGGVQVDNSNGQIEIDDQGASPPAIYSYAPPVNQSLALTGTTILNSSSDPVSITLNNTSSSVLTADDGLTDAMVYAFPGGGPASQTFTLPGAVDPIGSAEYPSEQY